MPRRPIPPAKDMTPGIIAQGGKLLRAAYGKVPVGTLISRALYLRAHGLLRENAIFTHLTADEKILLHRTLRGLDGDRICVEIGSYLGASTCFIAHAVSVGSRVVCIDTWGNDAMAYDDTDTDALPRDTYAEFRENTTPYRDKIVEIRAWSSEAFPRVRALLPSCDFLFIDGDHHQDAVARDWELYSTLLRPGSLVAFHDTGWADGVQRVIRESVAGRARLIAKLPNLQVFRFQ